VLLPRPVLHAQYTCRNNSNIFLSALTCPVYVTDAACLLRGTNWTLQRQTSNIKHINHPVSLSSSAITHSTQYYKISHKWYCRFLHTEHFCAVYSPVTLPWTARIDRAINLLGSLSVWQYSDSCLRATEVECVCVALRNREKLVLAACLFVRTKHLGSHWMDFHEIWYEDFPKICRENSSFIKI